MSKKEEWFASWFDTSYYHTLYKHRDHTEAKVFMKNLLDFLNLSKDSLLLDLACGKGRHAIYLNKLGYNVIGADLSANSIKKAKKHENERLKFVEHDMRNSFETKFDAIFNLFTSFGFFEDDNEDIAILNNIKNGLKKDGVAVIDYMNVKKVVANLVPKETQQINGIDFEITRYVENGFIVKEINFDADNAHHKYFEKVKYIDLEKMKSFNNAINFKIKHTFGDYQLNNFDEQNSDRLILVLE